MNDLISRQAAINAIGKKPFAEKADEYDYEQGLQNQWERDVVAIKILPSAEPEWTAKVYKKQAPAWIPCEEQLPEDFQKVLVFWWEHSKPMIDTAFWQKDAKRFDGQHWVRMEDKVTHWMPLPKPPAFNEVEE